MGIQNNKCSIIENNFVGIRNKMFRLEKKIPSDDHFNKKVKLFHFISNKTQNNL